MDDLGLGSGRTFRLIAHHPLDFAGLVGLALGGVVDGVAGATYLGEVARLVSQICDLNRNRMRLKGYV